jgi:hypothetical protein
MPSFAKVSAEKTLNVLIDGGPTLCLCVSSPRLEALLGPSEQRVGELSRALAHSEQQLGLLQAHCQAQAQQLQLLEDTCTQLSSAREMLSTIRSAMSDLVSSSVIFFL